MVQMNNHPADDSTSTNNSADDLTSPSNNAVDDSTSNHNNLSQRIFAERNTSSTSAVGRGVGRGQNISRPSNQTTSASIGQEVRRGVGRAGRYSSPYQHPTRSGEEMEEENYFPAPNHYERSNDDRMILSKAGSWTEALKTAASNWTVDPTFASGTSRVTTVSRRLLKISTGLPELEEW